MRQFIRNEISRIAPLDALERRHILDTLAWIDSGVDLFRTAKPATPPRHLISYFVLIDGDYVLLVDHINAALWLPTGGHVDPDENPHDTVTREAYEELGVKARFMSPSPMFLTVTDTVGLTAGHTDVSLWYVLRGDRKDRLVFDGSEFRDARWFHRKDMPWGRTDPHMKRFLSKLSLP